MFGEAKNMVAPSDLSLRDHGECLRKLLPEVRGHKTCETFPDCPASSCTSKRSFSDLWRLKTYLVSTVGQARLNHLVILNYHKTLLRNRNLEQRPDQFVEPLPV
ncbi:hypothetical protein ILYODFUR_018955 [Ilyodon furcidens]|uniref:Uncharacterized protein n=1 Tax=Ilyodon furcidens TaxID=33524 RepID=A0ABV0TJR7_9TELE